MTTRRSQPSARAAVLAVAVGLSVMGLVVLFHHQFQKVASLPPPATKIEEIRRSDPLPPTPNPMPPLAPEFRDAKRVPTIIYKRAELYQEPVQEVKPLVNEAAHPVKARTLPSQVQQEPDPPKHNNDGICARDGGHKITFHKRNGWESWRCVYPHRR